jgi:hypothetical protein
MSRRRPTLQRLWPSLSMGRLLAPPTNGTAAPYGLTQGARGRVWRRDGWFTCLGGEIKTTSKNGKEHGASALGGRHLIGRHNNQIGVGNHGSRDVREEVPPGWSVWGDVSASIWAAIRTTKKKQKYNTPWT